MINVGFFHWSVRFFEKHDSRQIETVILERVETDKLKATISEKNGALRLLQRRHVFDPNI